MDFIAVDVETANADMSSICAIGLVPFKNGQVFRNLSTLIDPEDTFDPMNIAIHGIRPQDVVGKPTMKAAYPALAKNLTNCILVHHSPFDRTAFRRVAQKHGFEEMNCAWLDSVCVARRAWHGLAGYGLAPLAHQFQIPFRHHEVETPIRLPHRGLGEPIWQQGAVG